MIIIKEQLLVGAVGDEQSIRKLFITTEDWFMHREISEVNLNNLINELVGGQNSVGFFRPLCDSIR